MRSDHSRQREEDGRPVREAFRDAENARQADVFMQLDDRYVVRGNKGREHIFENTGELVTSLVRSNKAHQRKLARRERYPVNNEQFKKFQEIFQ
jgi:hypothetical protein